MEKREINFLGRKLNLAGGRISRHRSACRSDAARNTVLSLSGSVSQRLELRRIRSRSSTRLILDFRFACRGWPRLYTREPSNPRDCVRRTIVQVRRPSLQPALTCSGLEVRASRAFLRHRSSLVSSFCQAGVLPRAARQPAGDRRPVNDYVHIEAADLCRPNARFTPDRDIRYLRPLGNSDIAKNFQGTVQRVEAMQPETLFLTLSE